MMERKKMNLTRKLKNGGMFGRDMTVTRTYSLYTHAACGGNNSCCAAAMGLYVVVQVTPRPVKVLRKEKSLVNELFFFES